MDRLHSSADGLGSPGLSICGQVDWRLIGPEWPQLGRLGSSPPAPSPHLQNTSWSSPRGGGEVWGSREASWGLTWSWDVATHILLIRESYKAAWIQRTGK